MTKRKNKYADFPCLSMRWLSVEKPQGMQFIPKGNFTVVINYPFSKSFYLKVQGPMSAYDVAVLIAQKYARLYKSKNIEYWHDLDSLVLNGLAVDLTTKTIEVIVGS